MDSVLEREVMVSTYLAQHRHRRDWLRLNEISELSGVGKSSLQRVLPRLKSRGWFESWRGESFDANEPAPATVFHFDLHPQSRVPVEIINEYNARVQKLKREPLLLALDDNALAYRRQEETYAEALASKNKHRKGKKVVSMPFKGRTEAWRRAFASSQARQYTFYRVGKFPFIFDFFFPRKILLPYGSPEPSVPAGRKRLWYNAARETLRVIEGTGRI